jgi:uncharacterized protein
MRIRFFILLLFLQVISPAKKPFVLVITGGHGYDTTAFFTMFDKMEGIRYEKILQPQANRKIAESKTSRYDVLVFYDMWQFISESEKQGYLQLGKSGKPMIFMHHSLVSYQEWPEFEEIRGGKYFENTKNAHYKASELSTYRHDVWVDYRIENPDHPVTRGLENFRLFDEVYGNYLVNKNAKTLLTTNHPESSPVVAWENRYLNSTILFIQPGHDSRAFSDQNFSRLIRQAIFYLAGKNSVQNSR